MERPENVLKKKRTQSHQRVTLCIRHIREIIDKGQVQDNKTRLKKEIQQLRKDYEIAQHQNGELYDLVEEEEHDTLNQWENDLANDVFSNEEEVEGAGADNVSRSVQNVSDQTSNVSGSEKDTSHASNTSGSGEDTSNASNTNGSGEDTSHASNVASSEAVTAQASGTNTASSTQVQTSPSLNLTVLETLVKLLLVTVTLSRPHRYQGKHPSLI